MGNIYDLHDAPGQAESNTKECEDPSDQKATNQGLEDDHRVKHDKTDPLKFFTSRLALGKPVLGSSSP